MLTSPIQKPTEIAQTDLQQLQDTDTNSGFQGSSSDNTTLGSTSMLSMMQTRLSGLMDRLNQMGQGYEFGDGYDPNGYADIDSFDHLEESEPTYSNEQLSKMRKGDHTLATKINEMDSHGIETTQFAHKKKEQLTEFSKDMWNQKFPNFSIERMTHVKDTALELNEMRDVYQTLDDDEIQSTIRSTLTGIAMEEAQDAGKKVLKKGVEAFTHLDIDGLVAAKDTAVKTGDIAYQFMTVSDDTVHEFADSFKEMQKVNGAQILTNMTVNSGVNAGLNSTGSVLSKAPHPVPKAIGFGMQGAAKLNQGVTTYSNVKTLSDVFDKKEAMEKQHPGAYDKILADLKESANAKKAQMSSMQQMDSQQPGDLHSEGMHTSATFAQQKVPFSAMEMPFGNYSQQTFTDYGSQMPFISQEVDDAMHEFSDLTTMLDQLTMGLHGHPQDVVDITALTSGIDLDDTQSNASDSEDNQDILTVDFSAMEEVD
ncbi:hypothetical protein [Thalassomonas actiniarum]|uniref:Uncharacterized protein n=1 Tax=Thalassomonas actiniarum TaxID=485447 RepID=A0AAF0C1B5_9GAMM|nr:hypothetical protein [Thalassomonas actiniarum]WDD96579.1 hypothetical protein SG35_014425 [Thalassomonas actiniarum]